MKPEKQTTSWNAPVDPLHLERKQEEQFERHVIEVMKARYLAEFEPDIALDPAALDEATDQARNARPDLFSNTDSPQTVSDPMGEGDGEASEPYVPDFTIIPDALAKYAEADESAEDFRKRAFSLLFRFGIAEGENFAGGGEPLTPDEKIKLLPMLIANFNAGNWLKLTEDLNPQA